MQKKSKEERKYVKILGIDILSTSKEKLLTSISAKITHNNKIAIFTPNPELVLAQTSNKLLKSALRSTKYLVPDGIGLKYATEFLYGVKLNIIPGRKLFTELIDMADKHKWKIFLLGGTGSEAADTAAKIKKGYKDIKILSNNGPKLNEDSEPISERDKKISKEVIEHINTFKPELLFVAFGNPKQEIWIYKNLSKLQVNAAMSVGGTFRYLAGHTKTPPTFLESLGLEWLWRLITEPKRIKRIFNATILFPIKIIMVKFGLDGRI